MIKVLTKREKTIFIFTVTVVCVAVVFNLFVAPLLNKNDTLNQNISTAKRKLKKYMELLNQADTVKAKYSKLASGIVLPEESADPVVQALSEIEEVAKNANIRILDIRPQPISGKRSGRKEIVVDLRAEGTIENYLRLLYNIESSLSLLRIKKLQLSSNINSQALQGTLTISELILGE